MTGQSRRGGECAQTTVGLFRAIDVAAFVTALVARLRAAGVHVDVTGSEAFARGWHASETGTSPGGSPRSRLYWVARITLVRDSADLPTFDAVFAAIFDLSSTAEGHTHAQPAGRSGSTNDVYVPVRPDTRRADQRDEPREETGAGLPWATLPAVTGAADHGTARLTIRSPSGAEATSGAPFGGVNDEELARLIGALARSRWPVRRSRRRRTSSGGTRIALRETLARARRYGWEPMELARDRPVHRPRPVVFLCDVSQSMQPHAAMYLQFMRALALTTDCEVFAFATSLTRLTPAMRRRSAAEAVAEAADEVVDRFGGTRIATNITAMLRSVHGCRTRGGVVIIASDGWDHDDPDELGAAMARLHRRAHTVVWMNPRADAPGFAPLVGSMRAALPYCDSFLPAGDLGGLADVIDAVAATA